MSRRALVTGGGGFLGGAIARLLIEQGATVRSFARGDYPVLQAQGIETIRGDLADAGAVSRAVEGVDLVFHVGAKAGVWGPSREYQLANVEGTRNVLNACRNAGVTRLVYTSSPCVVFNGTDMIDADESTPYPEHFEAPYPASKAEAERLVLAANGPGLSTVALRPHLIWGPGDNHLVPRILAKGRSGRLRRIGKRDVIIDATYIDNAAEAHLQAADRLTPGSPIAGRSYFLAQGEPVPLWNLVNGILNAGGLPPVGRSVPVPLARIAANCCEAVYKALRIHSEPPLTRFVVKELATSHWFDLTAARRDLGYAPKISTAEGLKRLAAWLGENPKLLTP